jgi:hypothetical protein
MPLVKNDNWFFEGVLLDEGMQMWVVLWWQLWQDGNNMPCSLPFLGTKYQILNMKSAISVGGSFFSMMHMSSSCIGFINTFLQGSSPAQACQIELQHITLWLVSHYLDNHNAAPQEAGKCSYPLLSGLNLNVSCARPWRLLPPSFFERFQWHDACYIID